MEEHADVDGVYGLLTMAVLANGYTTVTMAMLTMAELTMAILTRADYTWKRTKV